MIKKALVLLMLLAAPCQSSALSIRDIHRIMTGAVSYVSFLAIKKCKQLRSLPNLALQKIAGVLRPLLQPYVPPTQKIIATEIRRVPSFEGMICSLPLTIQNGPTDQLTITGDQESMQLVKTKVNNNRTLKIKLSKQSFFSTLFKPAPKLRCALTVAKRNDLSVQTTKEVRLHQLAINTLRFALSKSANCVGSLKRVEHLDVTACNKATVILTGTASQQTIQLDDATNYYAEKLASTNVSIIANMSGVAKVQASKEISGSKDGSGTLEITNVPAMVKIANVNPDVGNIRMPKAQVDPDLNRKSIQEAQQERYSS